MRELLLMVQLEFIEIVITAEIDLLRQHGSYTTGVELAINAGKVQSAYGLLFKYKLIKGSGKQVIVTAVDRASIIRPV